MTEKRDENPLDDGGVHRVDTVPPPDGEADAYSAPTKVGPVSNETWAKLIRQAADDVKASPAPEPQATPTPLTPPKRTEEAAAEPATASEELPQVYDRDEEDAMPTLLHAKSRPTQSPPPPAHVIAEPFPAAIPTSAPAPQVAPLTTTSMPHENLLAQTSRDGSRFLIVLVMVAAFVAAALALLSWFGTH